MIKSVTVNYYGPIVPYVRVGRERWTQRARRYFASRDAIRLTGAVTMNFHGLFALQGPLKVDSFTIVRRRKAGDLDNLLKAVLDALEGPVFENDRDFVEFNKVKLIRSTRSQDEDWFTIKISELGQSPEVESNE